MAHFKQKYFSVITYLLWYSFVKKNVILEQKYPPNLTSEFLF